MDARGAVEATLFTASGPLSVREIAERTSMSEEKVLNVLQDLIRIYDMMNSAIKIAKIGNDYAMALREEYAHFSDNYSAGEISKGMMKTLATIAYNQPIMQSTLAQNIGARVYEDVPALIELGLVHGKKVGQSKELTTTKKFMEYFGIEANSKDGIRKWIESMRNRSGTFHKHVNRGRTNPIRPSLIHISGRARPHDTIITNIPIGCR